MARRNNSFFDRNYDLDDFRRGRVYELYPEGFGYIFDEEDPSCSFLFRLEHLEGEELSIDVTDPDGIPVAFHLGDDDTVDHVIPLVRCAEPLELALR